MSLICISCLALNPKKKGGYCLGKFHTRVLCKWAGAFSFRITCNQEEHLLHLLLCGPAYILTYPEAVGCFFFWVESCWLLIHLYDCISYTMTLY